MIDFSGANGTLMKQLGKCGAVIANLRSNMATQYTALTSQATGIVGQLNAEPDIQAIAGNGYLGMLSGLGGTTGQLMSQIAQQAVLRAVYRDNPRVGQTLTQGDILACMQEVIRQMKLAGATVLAQTVSATPSAFVGQGNGALNASVVRPFDGRNLENLYAETVNVVCTSDSYTGGAQEGQESIRFSGAGQQSDPFAFDWPRGSGAQTTLTPIDGAQDNTSGNLLVNSGFDSFTGNVPDNWEVVAGTAGTNLIANTGVLYGGVSCLEVVGDGSGTLTAIRQKFGDSTGTSATLAPLSQYSFNVWMQRDGVPSSQGTIQFSLVDQNGTVVNDAAGNPNSFTQDLTALPTLYTPVRGCFRTPMIMPDSLYLKIALTVALDNGRGVFLDLGSLGAMTQFYTSGPFLAVHAGGVPFAQNDVSQITMGNSRGSGGTLNTWMTALQSLLLDTIMSNELLVPTSPSPTIPDSLLS